MLYIRNVHDFSWAEDGACQYLFLLSNEECESIKQAIRDKMSPEEPEIEDFDKAIKKLNDARVSELFFPERGQPFEPGKDICMSCPVQLHCLESALYRREKVGTWGGTSERTRRRIRRMRNIEKKRSHSDGESTN